VRRVIARLALALALAAAALPAAAATRAVQTGDFSRLRVDGPFDVRVRTGVAPSARITGPQAAIDRVIVEQNGDTLVVRPVRSAGWTNWSWGGGQPLVVEVSTHALAAAATLGSGTVAIEAVRGDTLDLSLGGSGNLSVGRADVAALKLAASGSGDLTVAGRAGRADALLVGSGNIRAAALAADTAVVKLVGSGDVALGARRSADVTLSGAGSVAIAGPAACTVHKSGSGDVRCEGGARGAAD
jgi:hypothetical protein